MRRATFLSDRFAGRCRRGVARALVACMVASSVLVAPARAQMAPGSLPALGDSDSADFTIATEVKLGLAIMREIRVDPAYLDDPLLLEYLDALWNPLVASARRLGVFSPDIDQRFAWEAFLVRDPSVNAFALPGGYVGVHLGLIALTTTPDELASVIGHEMAHVTQRHIARAITANSRRSLVTLAAMVLGLIAASRAGPNSSGDAIQAVVVGSQAAQLQAQLNFSRDAEREADRIGFQLMTATGFAPGGMAAMFEKMDTATRLNDYGNYPYLRSHPLTIDRVGEARARATARPDPGTPRELIGVLEHTVAQARARVLMDKRTDTLHRWRDRDADTGGSATDRLRAFTESGIAASLLRDWARADASFGKALAVVRGNPLQGGRRAERALTLMQAGSYLDRGDTARGLETMKPWADDGSRPVLLLRAQAALAQGRAPARDKALLDASAQQLQTWVATHPLDSLAWQALGQAWEQLGSPLRSLRAEAESRYALGDVVGAIDRLRAAQRNTRSAPSDFIDASVVDARLRAIEAERRQIEKDEKELR